MANHMNPGNYRKMIHALKEYAGYTEHIAPELIELCMHVNQMPFSDDMQLTATAQQTHQVTMGVFSLAGTAMGIGNAMAQELEFLEQLEFSYEGLLREPLGTPIDCLSESFCYKEMNTEIRNADVITIAQEPMAQLHQIREQVLKISKELLVRTKLLITVYQQEQKGLGAHNYAIEQLIEKLMAQIEDLSTLTIRLAKKLKSISENFHCHLAEDNHLEIK